MSGPRTTPTAAALSLALLAGAARAQPQLYFAEYKFQDAKISAMNLNGSNPHLLFAPNIAQWLPLGIVYSPTASKLYWIDSAGASEVMSAGLDGSGQTTILNPSGFCRGITLDAQGRIYFSSNNTLRRVNADGSNPIAIYTDPSTDPIGNPRVDAANAHVYVGAGGEIKRMDLDGSNLKTIVRGISQPRAICPDIAHNYIYWIDADTLSDYIGRARLDGSEFTVLIDNSPTTVGTSGLIDLLLDPAGSIYYADELTAKIYRADLNGQNAAPIYTSPAGYAPCGLALSTGEITHPLQDCNGNGVADDVDIAAGAPDCDNNGIIDTCQINPCPQRTFLLDQGSNAANASGRAVGTAGQFQVFQPFDVPTGASWSISEVATDGFTSNYADGTGITVRLYPDNGSGTIPNETQAIASTPPFNLRFNINNVNWVYAPLSATLGPGRYWARIEANNPAAYGGSLNFGFSGLQSKSRSSSGIFTSPANPIALRIVQACYANCDNSTTTPVLTANDFQCFLNKFAAQDPGANCDGSTTAPILTANDFQCFLNKYAAGC